ncbi:MAG: hypothetical protein ACR2MP_02535 [Streptosporangiaceae bacterium]
MLDTAVVKTEGGGRSVDVDDLVALAAVLDVSPNVLLLPESVPPMVQLGETHQLTPAASESLGRMWAWATGEQPLTPGTKWDEAEFALQNRPHRFSFSQESGLAPLGVLDLLPVIRKAVTDLMNGGVSSWQLRTIFEQILNAELRERVAENIPVRRPDGQD